MENGKDIESFEKKTKKLSRRVGFLRLLSNAEDVPWNFGHKLKLV